MPRLTHLLSILLWLGWTRAQCLVKGCADCQENLCVRCLSDYILIGVECQLQSRQSQYLRFDGYGGELGRISITPEDSKGTSEPNAAANLNGSSGSEYGILHLDQVVTIAGCSFQSGGRCILCFDGYIFNPITNTCRLQSNKCITLNAQQFFCQDCLPTLSLNGGVDCFDRKCLTGRWNYYFCEECAPGFVSSSDGICLDHFCLQYRDGLCETCRVHFTINLSHPLRLCVRTFPENCLENRPDNALLCRTCMEGFFLTPDHQCQSLCLDFGVRGCTRCRQIALLMNGQCYQRNSLYCSEFNFETGNCTACHVMYIPDGAGGCTASNSENQYQERKDLFCAQYSPKEAKCLSCLTTHYLDLNTGVCTAGNTTTCLTFNILGGNCTSCRSGMSLAQVNHRVVCSYTSAIPRTSIQGCIVYESGSGKCIKCVERYYPANNGILCKGVSSVCNRYRESDGSCIDCVVGYRMVGGKCQQPPRGNDPCCVSYSLELECLACAGGYALQNSGCCVTV